VGRAGVAIVDERLAFLEGRLAEQSRMFADIREDGRQFELRLDGRFTSIERRLTDLDQSLAAVRRDASIDFRWIVGIQLTTLIAVVAALAGALASR
jgi:hypothetical protein